MIILTRKQKRVYTNTVGPLLSEKEQGAVDWTMVGGREIKWRTVEQNDLTKAAKETGRRCRKKQQKGQKTVPTRNERVGAGGRRKTLARP